MTRQWILNLIVALGGATSVAGVVRASVLDTTSGLFYHLDAGVGVTKDGDGKVSNWNNAMATPISGYENNFSQPTASQQPSYVANAINGLSAIQFNADDNNQLVSGSLAAAQTVVIVNKTGVNPNGGGLSGIWGQYDGVNSTDSGIRRSYAPGSWDDTGGWENLNASDFAYGGSMSINGTPGHAQAIGQWGIMLATSTAMQVWQTALGNYFYPGTPRSWDGQIAEVAVFNRVLTAEEQSAIVGELDAKYNISGVPEPGTVIMLLTAGCVALMAYAWRKRK